jgi:hypothetical protein
MMAVGDVPQHIRPLFVTFPRAEQRLDAPAQSVKLADLINGDLRICQISNQKMPPSADGRGFFFVKMLKSIGAG